MDQGAPEIRRLTAEDYAAVARLLVEGDRLHQPFDPLRITQGDVQPITRDDYQSFLASDGTFAVGVFRGSELAGFLRAIMVDKPAGRLNRATKLARIEEIVVREALRRTGLGQRLTHAVRHWAHDSGRKAWSSGSTKPTRRRSRFTRILDSGRSSEKRAARFDRGRTRISVARMQRRRRLKREKDICVSILSTHRVAGYMTLFPC